MPQKQQEFGTILRALGQHNVRYVLIGGLAMVVRGSAHVTQDADIVFVRDRNNILSLVSALAPYNPRPRGFPPDLPFVWDQHAVQSSTILTLDTDVGIVDLLGEIPETGTFAELWSRADWFTAFGVQIRVAAIDDLITMKKTANRPKDLAHLLELQAMKKIVEDS